MCGGPVDHIRDNRNRGGRPGESTDLLVMPNHLNPAANCRRPHSSPRPRVPIAATARRGERAIDRSVRSSEVRKMITELALATFMVLLTVAIHAAGIFALSRFLRLEEREETQEHIHPLSLRGIAPRSSSFSAYSFSMASRSGFTHSFTSRSVRSMAVARPFISRRSPMAPLVTATRQWRRDGAWFLR